MTEYVARADLNVHADLARFIETRALDGVGIDASGFWSGLSNLFERFAPENRALLAERDRMQVEIDRWHAARRDNPMDPGEYRAFLSRLGYLAPEPTPFQIDSERVDKEISHIAGPQLVVPVLNARFLLNAVNARWGSLYDALYGTDAIPGRVQGPGYDKARGAQVIAFAKAFLDEAVPLAEHQHADIAGWRIEAGELFPRLAQPDSFVGYRGDPTAPTGLLFRHYGLHIELVLDRAQPVGRDDPAGLADVILESAITTIVDLEDSIAAVDAADKTAAYANWLGVMRGDLGASFEKGGRSMTRHLAGDRSWRSPASDEAFELPGRSLLFVRNVGHLMTTPAILLPDRQEAPEGILDAAITALIGMHDLRELGRCRNSRAGSIYIVKPKMHGPAEADFANRLFDAVEDLLGLPRHTIKIGLMDEERRTSVNLAACIAAVKHRIVFINTGFLDRTGDEIHTSMEAGGFLRKADLRTAGWIRAYEDRNVRIGLACGFGGRAQIGKGMWAAPDRMADMMAQKIAHPMAGASTAWVPSPSAATLHAMHYHRVDVWARQAALRSEPPPGLDALLAIPLAGGHNWTPEQIRDELDNNAQGILGYVVRWIDQGIGCSKVPDIHDIGLMEDRATLRISSQHIANWLHHGVCDSADVDAALLRMAVKVDAQNAGDPNYTPMTPNVAGSLAFAAARALIFEGRSQPNGYTEPLLHAFRRKAKARHDANPPAT